MSQEFNMRPEIVTPSLALVRIFRAKLSLGGLMGETKDPRLQLTVSLRRVNDNGDVVDFTEVAPDRFHINTWMSWRRFEYEGEERVYTETQHEADVRFSKRLVPLAMALRLPYYNERHPNIREHLKGYIQFIADEINENLADRIPMAFLCKGVTTEVGQPRMVDLAPGPDGQPRRELRTPRFARTPYIDRDNTHYYLAQLQQQVKQRQQLREEQPSRWEEIDEVTEEDRSEVEQPEPKKKGKKKAD